MRENSYSPELRERLRDLVARKGVPVEINEAFDPKDPWNFESEVSVYGWTDYKAQLHAPPAAWASGRSRSLSRSPRRNTYMEIGTCNWVVPEGVVLRERSYSQFDGTGCDNEDEVGINVYGCHCECGQYTDMVLRYTASLADTIRELTAPDESVPDPGIVL